MDLTMLYDLIPRLLPLECLHARFMQRALVGLILLGPAAGLMGVQMVNFRMAFFSDAISHSAFTGVALGLLLGWDPRGSMALFAALVGLGIVAAGRRVNLSADTVIGVFFSAIIAFGIAVVSRDRALSRDVQRFLYGDILTLTDGDILGLGALLLAVLAFLAWGYNALVYIGVHPGLAQIHGIRVKAHQYLYALLLALVVICAVWAVGMFLVTALLIVPAASARNMARSAGAMPWWAALIGLTSSVAGLLISGQDWARTATGATVVLCAAVWFVLTAFYSGLRRSKG